MSFRRTFSTCSNFRRLSKTGVFCLNCFPRSDSSADTFEQGDWVCVTEPIHCRAFAPQLLTSKVTCPQGSAP